MNLPRSQVIPKVKKSVLAILLHSLSVPLEPVLCTMIGSGSQLQRLGVRSGSRVIQSGVTVLPSPSPVCRSPMKGATAVLSATVLVPRFPKQLNLVLVRIQCSSLQPEYKVHVTPQIALITCTSLLFLVRGWGLDTKLL